MTISSIHFSIGIMVFSFSMGFLIYYFITDLIKEEKKNHMDKVLGQLINFVIFIWIGKILLNITTFIVDPIAILSYPSNSHAFYLAVLFSLVTIVFQWKLGRIDVLLFLNAFIHIFLSASFVYEFIQITWNGNMYSIGYMGLVALLMIVIVIIRDLISLYWLNLLIILLWTIGSFILSVRLPIMMVFGFTIVPWFFALIFLICLLQIIFWKKKEGAISGGN
ncbi:hypothetical protein M3638_04920 [Oceanobacillus profundus]|uniref:hypothetical protein n=1 Tax=Oceanobacillus profundus TaxID=372463 RepID=UPI00203C424C|nr:hypothetical protein [Oceanobacillus profundus]MCM3397178.1 hypothetical protein [Oceanobacillus profundus]